MCEALGYRVRSLKRVRIMNIKLDVPTGEYRELSKKELGLLTLGRCSNNTQLLTNSGASSKRFILFKLFIPKSKSINLAFLIANLL